MRDKPARKQPRQARSRATVTAILEAMTRILDQEGAEAATTTRVVPKSIPSLIRCSNLHLSALQRPG